MPKEYQLFQQQKQAVSGSSCVQDENEKKKRKERNMHLPDLAGARSSSSPASRKGHFD